MHRDSETSLPDPRFEEVRRALLEASCEIPAIAVVPVRMTEAWLLLDQQAIRRTAGNPNGSTSLPIPTTRWDELPDPKQVLHDACELQVGWLGGGGKNSKFLRLLIGSQSTLTTFLRS